MVSCATSAISAQRVGCSFRICFMESRYSLIVCCAHYVMVCTEKSSVESGLWMCAKRTIALVVEEE